jgi:hypothetical protein
LENPQTHSASWCAVHLVPASCRLVWSAVGTVLKGISASRARQPTPLVSAHLTRRHLPFSSFLRVACLLMSDCPDTFLPTKQGEHHLQIASYPFRFQRLWLLPHAALLQE